MLKRVETNPANKSPSWQEMVLLESIHGSEAKIQEHSNFGYVEYPIPRVTGIYRKSNTPTKDGTL